jgi:sugar phosphate isomerase/epimerase
VEELAAAGFHNIELSGGTQYYAGFEEDLLKLKKQYGLNYIVHNYFPPPVEDFVFNLASLDDGIFEKSIALAEKAVGLCRKLGSEQFGFHAGFLVEFTMADVGKKLALKSLNDLQKATQRFCEGFYRINKRAQGIELYLENNVLSAGNAKTYEGQMPLMMVDYEGYEGLRKRLEFKLLLDAAHLKVSCISLNRDYTQQLSRMMAVSDYIHISDNDGLQDQSRCFTEDSAILNSLAAFDFKGKTITCETYGSVAQIKASYGLIKERLRLT